MILRQLFDQVSSTYTYLLADERTRAALLIDCVFEQHARDRALLRELELDLRWVLDTHCHADHVTGAKPVVAVCQTGKRAAMATAILSNAGVAQVANLAGGMVKWRELGLPS